MTMQPFSAASMQITLDTLLPEHTTMQPASISMAASWLSLRLPTMTRSPLVMVRSMCSALPEPMRMLPSTYRPSMSPTSTVPSRVSTTF